MNGSLKNAAKSLHAHLSHFPWLQMVGVANLDGADGLIVYVNRSNQAVQTNVPTQWEGFAVTVRQMSDPTPINEFSEPFRDAYAAFDTYVTARERLADAMADVGISTRNVDPFANFAEVFIANELHGTIQPATNEGFDVLTRAGVKIQVKSLRVSSDKPEDNGLSWHTCTRKTGKADAPPIDADEVAVVVYLDFRPYAAFFFPVEPADRFPVLRVKHLMFGHAKKLLDGQYSLAHTGVRFIDLRDQAAT